MGGIGMISLARMEDAMPVHSIQAAVGVALAGLCFGMHAPVHAEPGQFHRMGVRAVGTSIADLLTAGRDRSPTFRSLLRDIDASGWIVFVQTGSCQVAQLSSCLLHRVGVFEGRHYLRLVVGNQALSDEAIATIGHELQHALEVTSALGITEGPQIRQLYRRIGYVSVRAPGAEVYETTAAINARATVLRELRSTRPR